MHFSERQKHLPPNFMMDNYLFQDLYDVDAPAHWEAYGRKLQKRKAREKLKGNGKGEETGKRKIVVVDRHWGPGQSPGREEFSCILRFTNHLWSIDNLIFYNPVIQHSWVDLTRSGGKTFPPWPNLETVCLHPPSVEGPDVDIIRSGTEHSPK